MLALQFTPVDGCFQRLYHEHFPDGNVNAYLHRGEANALSEVQVTVRNSNDDMQVQGMVARGTSTLTTQYEEALRSHDVLWLGQGCFF